MSFGVFGEIFAGALSAVDESGKAKVWSHLASLGKSLCLPLVESGFSCGLNSVRPSLGAIKWFKWSKTRPSSSSSWTSSSSLTTLFKKINRLLSLYWWRSNVLISCANQHFFWCWLYIRIDCNCEWFHHVLPACEYSNFLSAWPCNHILGTQISLPHVCCSYESLSFLDD